MDSGLRRNDGGLRRNDDGFRRNDGGFRRNDGGFRWNDGGLRRNDGSGFHRNNIVLWTCFVFSLCFLSQTHAAVTHDRLIDAAIAADRPPADRIEDQWRNPRVVLQMLEPVPGQRVLDYFGGPGYYSELLSRIVGPSGEVLLYNNELYRQAAHSNLMKRLTGKRLANVKIVTGAPNYLHLDHSSIDSVLFAWVYHDLYWQPASSPDPTADAQKALKILFDALRPGGYVVVVDHIAEPTTRTNVTRVANRMHRIDPEIVREDFERAGFEWAGESAALRNVDDDHRKSVFDLSVRRRTDQFIYRFRKPVAGSDNSP